MPIPTKIMAKHLVSRLADRSLLSAKGADREKIRKYWDVRTPMFQALAAILLTAKENDPSSAVERSTELFRARVLRMARSEAERESLGKWMTARATLLRQITTRLEVASRNVRADVEREFVDVPAREEGQLVWVVARMLWPQGPLAVTQTAQDADHGIYSITHLPTGYRVAPLRKEVGAIRLLQVLLKLPVPWSSTQVTELKDSLLGQALPGLVKLIDESPELPSEKDLMRLLKRGEPKKGRSRR